jgi:enterochelin esterase family protein
VRQRGGRALWRSSSDEEVQALKLFWWGWGETDIARANGLAVIDKIKSEGVKIETRESPGGHTWDNWRLYLYEVAPKLFR